ncbi:hypothetical protein M427DRAFT_63848 [Gonapodya prolifera JEL478]|uniref:Uncharacterized protein n=1 Tax=Gonapodya prolifera (strain JEL478) TaxID=1344416 RepID=A0A138ZZJ3_GONPJ|nr:hypothetical protein M427DRAFT_63848 [Gonapodya prolifera JEL478]|eukprot:KXS09553.1 hypothetical protein M427DRAFT_63848 [Gonapodya prolifera JEL478]
MDTTMADAAADTVPDVDTPLPLALAHGPPSLPLSIKDDDLHKHRRAVAEKQPRILAKATARFFTKLADPAFDPDTDHTLLLLLDEIDQMEALATKSRLAHKAAVREIASYHRAEADVASQIDTARTDVHILNSRLIAARQERRNRLEYDAVARQVLKLPSRGEIEGQTAVIQTNLSQLDADLRALHDAWDTRRKQFHHFLLAGYELAEGGPGGGLNAGGAEAGAGAGVGGQGQGQVGQEGQETQEEEEGRVVEDDVAMA